MFGLLVIARWLNILLGLGILEGQKFIECMFLPYEYLMDADMHYRPALIGEDKSQEHELLHNQSAIITEEGWR